MQTTIDIDQPRGPLIRWGAVFAGAVWGLALMAVLSTLWLALAYPSNSEIVRDNLQWFVAGSGAFALFVAGLVAGMLSENRGIGSGWLHGMTAWGLLLITALIFGLPSVFGLFSVGQLRTIDSTDLVGPAASDALWATFLTLVIGAAAAMLGGFMGGATPRRTTNETQVVRRTTDDVDGWREGTIGRHEAQPDTMETTAPSDRVMVSRGDDGAYTDQNGRRYVPEETVTGPRRTDDTL